MGKLKMSHEISKKLAEQFIERAEALKLKGTKLEDAALNFWCGAATALELAGNSLDATLLARQAALLVAVRGYVAVQDIARGR